MTKFDETWNTVWDASIHETDHSKKRIASAKEAKLTPITVDCSDGFAYFSGAHGHYETWLDHCSCVDFARFKTPCKHIYRLAMELHILHDDFENRDNESLMFWKDVVKITDTLSEDAQDVFLGILRPMKNGDILTKRKKKSPFLDELFASSLLKNDPAKETAKFYTFSTLAEYADEIYKMMSGSKPLSTKRAWTWYIGLG